MCPISLGVKLIPPLSDSFRIDIEASDNIGVESISWENAPFQASGFSFEGSADQPGNYTVRIIVEDAEGNKAETSFLIRVVDDSGNETIDDDSPGEDNDYLIPASIIAITVLVILVVTFLFYKSRKGGLYEE